MIHKRTARRKSLQHDGLLQSASHQTKLWIESALKKANTAVKHDTVNDFEDAIFYYSEAVDLLNKVLKNSKESKEDMDGLKAICDIYLERIDFLSYIMHTDSGNLNKKKDEANSPKDSFENKNTSIIDFGSHNPDTKNPSDQIPDCDTQNIARSSKQESFNSVFLNMFAKRKSKKKVGTHHLFSSTKQESERPKMSKSTPTSTPELSWKCQANSKSHHLSSDQILSSARSSLTSYQAGSTDALCLPMRENKTGYEKSRTCLPIGKGFHSKSFEKREMHPNEDRVSPTLPRRNCNRNSPSSNMSCSSSSIYNEVAEDYNSRSFKKLNNGPCLTIPKKSSQRRPNSTNSSDSILSGKHISEPTRESSLNHMNSWRTRNSPSVSSSYEFSNTDIPNDFERKVDSLASHSLTYSLPARTRRRSTSRLNKISGCLDLSNAAINSSTESTVPSPSTIKIPIPGTAKIDPYIIMSYPEAMTFSNESLTDQDRPQSPLKNGYITDKLYISKGFF